jgi:hypothetical protein
MLHGLENTTLTVTGAVGIRSTRAEDGASPGKDASDNRHVQGHRVAVERATPAVPETDEFISVSLNALAYDGPDDGIQSRTVPTACKHTDPHSR